MFQIQKSNMCLCRRYKDKFESTNNKKYKTFHFGKTVWLELEKYYTCIAEFWKKGRKETPYLLLKCGWKHNYLQKTLRYQGSKVVACGATNFWKGEILQYRITRPLDRNYLMTKKKKVMYLSYLPKKLL